MQFIQPMHQQPYTLLCLSPPAGSLRVETYHTDTQGTLGDSALVAGGG